MKNLKPQQKIDIRNIEYHVNAIKSANSTNDVYFNWGAAKAYIDCARWLTLDEWNKTIDIVNDAANEKLQELRTR